MRHAPPRGVRFSPAALTLEEIMYLICCCNEWCSGPERHTLIEARPTEPIPCPTCGWLALPYDSASVRFISDVSDGEVKE